MIFKKYDDLEFNDDLTKKKNVLIVWEFDWKIEVASEITW